MSHESLDDARVEVFKIAKRVLEMTDVENLRYSPLYEGFRSDPRYDELIRRQREQVPDSHSETLPVAIDLK